MHEVHGLFKNGGLHSLFKYQAFFSFIFPCRPRYIGRCTCWMLAPFVKKKQLLYFSHTRYREQMTHANNLFTSILLSTLYADSSLKQLLEAANITGTIVAYRGNTRLFLLRPGSTCPICIVWQAGAGVASTSGCLPLRCLGPTHTLGRTVQCHSIQRHLGHRPVPIPYALDALHCSAC